MIVMAVGHHVSHMMTAVIMLMTLHAGAALLVLAAIVVGGRGEGLGMAARDAAPHYPVVGHGAVQLLEGAAARNRLTRPA